MITAFAENAAKGGEQAAEVSTAGGMAGGIIGLILPLLMMFLVFYFLIIRPQKKQQRKMSEMLAGLQVGDKIVTIGGVVGKITKIKDDEVIIETGAGTDKSHIKFQKAAISTVLTIHE